MALAFSYGVYNLCKLMPDPRLAQALLGEPLGQMAWVLGQGLVLPAIFHELFWEPTDVGEAVEAEVFD